MRAILFLFIFQLSSLNVQASSDEGEDWGDDWGEETPSVLINEILYGYAYLLDDKSVNVKNTVLNELRFNSDFEYKVDSYTFNLELEFYADGVTDESFVELDELNFLIPFADNYDLKIGRQMITWGTADLLFLNDLFVKDWKSFFNGRNDTDLKDPMDAIRISHYSNLFNYEIAFIPQFEADKVLTGERYSFYVPNLGIIQPQPEVNIQQPDDSEMAARLFGNNKGHEWAIYAYRGFFKSPSQFDLNGVLSYTKMNALGVSVRKSWLGGLFNIELVHYESKEDQAGTNPFIANSQSRYLIGFEKEIVNELTLGTQIYLEKTENYQALIDNLLVGQLAADEKRTMLTIRLTQQALDQKLLNSLMVFYSPSDKDHYLRYSSSYKLSDQWKIIGGLNLLNGNNESTFFAQLRDNSNIYFRIHYNFE